MRLRNVPGSKEAIDKSDYCVTEPEQYRGRWRSLYGDAADAGSKLLYLEIGTGKGRFIEENARINRDILYLGLEKYSSVLIKGLRRQEEEKLPNLMFVRTDAEIITEIFDVGEIDRIYLNFSDPWPKTRHAGRRLPSERFLRRYDRILSPGGMIEFKTDNEELFDFALEEAERAGYSFVVLTRDLHADEELSKDNIMTEYEERFSSMGHPIFKYTITRR